MTNPYLLMRITLAAIAVVGIFLWPPWISFACMVILSVFFRAWEVIFIGLALDFLYLPPISARSLPLFTLCATTLVWLFEPLRRELLHSDLI